MHILPANEEDGLRPNEWTGLTWQKKVALIGYARNGRGRTKAI